LQQASDSFLTELADSARERVRRGYYSGGEQIARPKRSLVGALGNAGRIPIIAEVKFRSPAEGLLRTLADPVEFARSYETAGAAGISVLTEPEHFDGHIEYLSHVRREVAVPLLMKDIIVDPAQVDAGQRRGADAVLLITAVFDGRTGGESLESMVDYVHSKGLESLVEVHDEKEYDSALSSEADVVGINNRDLRTLSVSLDVSRRLLGRGPHSKPVICESGIRTRGEIEMLTDLGADGFLLGSVLMKSIDPAATLGNLLEARPRPE
jgi:indole-3-glycerol phosphate synthase